MESTVKIQEPLLETTKRLSSLSIVVDDFDCENSNRPSFSSANTAMAEVSFYQPSPRPYTRQSSDAMIQKMLEEAEHRKQEFWQLIDEHNAVVENLKKMEQIEGNVCCEVAQPNVLRT